MDVSNCHLRQISFGGSTVAIWWHGPRAGEVLEFLFRRIPVLDTEQPPAIVYRLIAEDDASSLRLYREQDVLYLGESEVELAGRLLGDVCQALASHSTRGLVFHASALAWQGKGVLLPGTMGVGKSTLTAWLLTQGFEYLTDEMVYIEKDTKKIEAFSRPLNLRRSSRFVWQGLESKAESNRTIWNGEDFDLVQPDLFQNTPLVLESNLDLVVFARYEPTAAFELLSLTKAQASLELMKHFVNARNLPAAGFPDIAHLMRKVPAYRMRYSNFQQVEGQIERLLEESGRV